MTLDLAIATSRGRRFKHGVVEFKSAGEASSPPSFGLEPIKLSKFL
jgi:hypothetical protein